MKLAICDDVRKDADIAIKIINDFFIEKKIEADVVYKSPNDVLNELNKGVFEYNIVILDIDYKSEDYNGIDLGKNINIKHPFCIIIYLSGILDFASDVYETNHCYFVLKKNQKITLKRALEKAINIYIINNEYKKITIVSDGKRITIPTCEICYITREGRRIKVCCKETVYECYLTLNNITGILPDNFARCHTGFIVNFDYVKRLESNSLILNKEFKVPIGRIYKDHFIRNYLDYLERRI